MAIEVGYAVAEAFVACVANRKREIEAAAGQYRKSHHHDAHGISGCRIRTLASAHRAAGIACGGVRRRHVRRDLAADTPGTAKVLLQRVRGTA